MGQKPRVLIGPMDNSVLIGPMDNSMMGRYLTHGAKRGPIGQARGELWIIGSLRMGQKPRGAERGTFGADCNGAKARHRVRLLLPHAWRRTRPNWASVR